MGNRKKSAVVIARDPMRYLKPRGSKWHYIRRVPANFAHIDGRGLIQASLKTSSLDVAQLRRDALERADDLFWLGLSHEHPEDNTHTRYQAAKARAVALGFEYKGVVDIADSAPIAEVVQRLAVAAAAPARDREAVLGVEGQPKLTVRKVMKLYVDEIGLEETVGMSPAQLKSWRKVKLAAAERFIEAMGNKTFLDLTRVDAIEYHRWWREKIAAGKKGAKPQPEAEKDGKAAAAPKKLSGNTANRSFGNIRKLFREYTRYLALDIKNPFDDLSFSDPKSLKLKVLPFSQAFMEKSFLAAGSLKSLNREARLILLTMIETGCRPSEICNLTPAQIHLDAPVPYLQIIYRPDRKVKTENSVRDVPLVGVSLEAMKRAKTGFPRYFDKETNLSATLMNYLRDHKLLPSANHRVYSVRHAYEKRMLEAGFDDEFRRRILGHDTDRPDYGDGGELSWRRDQMLKIVLPFDASILG
ncbi:tyrosine-type recombinase/integrase [Ensifer sp. Root31]|uniref:DUF6538 domain-containing protein n=1 Tax=Ensifer sp. Root31 TaxID=1736512 RepID=UPI000A6C0536|nr:tyrosine-type recombinase/integrase [Ensifer sp. Root31]